MFSSDSKEPLVVLDLGLVTYDQGLAIQEELHSKVKEGVSPPHLVLCSHPAVITLGTSASAEHILATQQKLEEHQVAVTKSNRGGNVTLHGPGQLIAYPILDLRRHGRTDVHWYMRSLEEVLIRTLHHQAIHTQRIDGKTGVWINNTNRKIASIGVRLRRWCTLHGFALNVFEEPLFDLINPCGLTEIIMTSIQEELGVLPEIETVKQHLVVEFTEIFSVAPPSRVVAQASSLWA